VKLYDNFAGNMKDLNLYLFILLIILPVASNAKLEQIPDNSLHIQKDFRNELKYFDAKREIFLPLSNHKTEAVYFSIDLSDFKNRYLLVKAKKGTSIFVDNQYVSKINKDVNLLSVDSLILLWPKSTTQIALYHPSLSLKDLRIEIIKVNKSEEDHAQLSVRRGEFEKDFYILATIVLLIILAVLLSTNPRFTSEYLNIRRVLAFRDRDENILNARLSSPINLVYYSFCAMITSLVFIILLNSDPTQYELSRYTESTSLLGAMFRWILISFIILLLIVAKIFLLYSLTRMYNIRGFLPLHHFNFIRLSLITFGLGLVFSLAYMLSGLTFEGFHSKVLVILCWVYGIWGLILFLKLINKAEFRISHLFSYICGSEIIPFLVIIKVLYF
jgi:hypothetical protein